MPVVEILQVDAFTTRPCQGNPAGVVLDADGLSDEQMRRVAAEMNVPETAFLAPSSRPDAAYRLRWLTPAGREVTFCGHATVAAVHALVERRRLEGDRVLFDTLGGPLPVGVSREPTGPVIWLEPAPPACPPYAEPVTPILEALGTGAEGLASWARPALTPERDLLLPAAGLAVLKALAPRMERLAALGEARGLRGICLTARETFEPGSLIASRFFAPHYGIPEDPVSGSVHAALAVWLWDAGVLRPAEGRVDFRAEQGDLLGRPGRLRVTLRLLDGRPVAVGVGGQAVTVLSGSLRVE
jgi:trans-2,3-dihydro-3-hydroxyanthranilate isomerase